MKVKSLKREIFYRLDEASDFAFMNIMGSSANLKCTCTHEWLEMIKDALRIHQYKMSSLILIFANVRVVG